MIDVMIDVIILILIQLPKCVSLMQLICLSANSLKEVSKKNSAIIWKIYQIVDLNSPTYFRERLVANYVSRILALSSHSVVRPSVSPLSTTVTSNIFSTIWCFRPYKLYIFWKLLVQGYQNWYYQVSHTQIHKYKDTNTQIQHMKKCQKDPTCGIFLKRRLFKGIKNDIPMCQTHKYKYKIHKYTNTAYDEVPERPNMWYIF